VEAGAAGVLNKTAHLEEVVEAVRRLRAGQTLMPLEEVVELLRGKDVVGGTEKALAGAAGGWREWPSCRCCGTY
jgi:DNA-binding NarL/FixJ family response regulator